MRGERGSAARDVADYSALDASSAEPCVRGVAMACGRHGPDEEGSGQGREAVAELGAEQGAGGLEAWGGPVGAGPGGVSSCGSAVDERGHYGAGLQSDAGALCRAPAHEGGAGEGFGSDDVASPVDSFAWLDRWHGISASTCQAAAGDRAHGVSDEAAGALCGMGGVGGRHATACSV